MAPELIAVCDAMAAEAGKLADALRVLAMELRGLRDEGRAALGLTPIADERQGSIAT